MHRNTELMFLPARRARGHSVYLASAAATGRGLHQQLKWKHLVDLVGDANIARPSVALSAPLDANAEYAWRVDTKTPAGVVPGPVWTLRTGTNLSCQITPDPPPLPPIGCAAVEQALCPGEAGKGARVGDRMQVR